MGRRNFFAASLIALFAALGSGIAPAADKLPALDLRSAAPQVPGLISANPAIILTNIANADATGTVTSYQPAGATITSGNPYFTTLGTNGRTCLTCHQMANGWGLSTSSIQALFTRTAGTDPLFRPVDGAVCPSDSVITLTDRQQAYRLLLAQGLIRIGLAMPANAQFTIAVQTDPDKCTGTAATGLISSSAGTVNTYRRPLPTTNLPFLSAIMWDGREPDLAHQALDAVLIHEQASTSPSTAQQAAAVSFENGLYTAQSSDSAAGDLSAVGGGPVALSNVYFTPGINDSIGQNPIGVAFNPAIFTLYASWNNLPGTDPQSQARASIARGEQIFNTKPITITTVPGLNDQQGRQTVPGTCGTCHDTPSVGNRSRPLFLNMGIAATAPPGLTVTQLPVFAVTCSTGAPPGAANPAIVTDPGRALTTGLCADIGKFKVPVLRGLASRAPYFHNGGAATLNDVLNFYQKRFTIAFTQQERTDLINFLNAL